MFRLIKGLGSRLCFMIAPRKQTVVEEVECLISDKFYQILFSGVKGEDRQTMFYAYSNSETLAKRKCSCKFLRTVL